MIPPATDAALLQELLGDEGEVLRVYDDATGRPVGKGSTLIGNPTIGIGRCLSTNGISPAESRALNQADRAAAWAELLTVIPWIVNETVNRQIVILGLYFNTALHAPQHFVAVGWPHFLQQVETGDYEGAAQNLETSHPWASQVGPRAARYAAWMRQG